MLLASSGIIIIILKSNDLSDTITRQQLQEHLKSLKTSEVQIL